MTWNPDLYLRFASQRALPFHHLVAAVADLNPRTVVDLGCGPGGLTTSLLERWPTALIVGVDESEEMIAHSRRRAVPGGEHGEFLAEYGVLLGDAYPERDGSTLFPFRRIFVVARFSP